MRFKNCLRTGLGAVAVWLAMGSSTAHAVSLVQSTFDSSTEGWGLYGDGITVVHNPTGGVPGGFISITDNQLGGAFGFSAPASFLGNKSSAYGGTLTFSLSQSGQGNQVDTDDVVLIGGGLTLAIDAGANPAFFGDWTNYNVSLLASAGWKIGNISGANATEAQLQQVLANLTELRIRGEFQGAANGLFADTGRLDGVGLESGPAAGVPEPSSLILLGLGIVAGSVIARRKRFN